MVMRESIIKRVDEICKDSKRAAGEICLSGGMTPSTYYDFANGRTKVMGIETIKKICQGAEMTLSEFFDREYFNDYED